MARFVFLATLALLLPFLIAVARAVVDQGRRRPGVARRVRTAAFGILSMLISVGVFPLMLLVMAVGWLLHGLSVVRIALKGR